MSTTEKILALARKNLGSNDSARLCMEDAMRNFDASDYVGAQKRAIDSLRHSVGIFHSDYIRAEVLKISQEKKNAARRAKHDALTSLGLKRVKGALGGVYYE